MKRLKKILIFAAALVLAGCFCVSVRASGLVSVSEKHPAAAYPVGYHDKVTLYEDQALTTEKRQVSYRKFLISKIETDAVHVSCTVSGETVEGWAARKTFLTADYSKKVQTYALSGLQLYRSRDTSAKLEYIPAKTGGYTIGKKDYRYQVMFYLNKRYYLGWVTAKEYETKLRPSMTVTEQPLADGVYYMESKRLSGKVLTCTDGTLSLEESAGTKKQRFRLTYQKNGTYLITSYDGNYYLTSDGKHVSAGTEKTGWILSRNGSSFVLKEKTSENALGATENGTLKAEAFHDTNKYKWTLTKKAESKTAEDSTYTVFSQFDPRWANTVYCQGNPVRTIASSGCGVMAYVNAIYALNGQYIDPRFLAEYSNSHGHYVYMAGTDASLYPSFAARYGSVYHFKWSGRTESTDTLKKHLSAGGTAIANVPNHYLAIVAYRKSDNKFLVLDSAITGSRATTISGDWVDESALHTGTLKAWYYHLFSTAK